MTKQQPLIRAYVSRIVPGADDPGFGVMAREILSLPAPVCPDIDIFRNAPVATAKVSRYIFIEMSRFPNQAQLVEIGIRQSCIDRFLVCPGVEHQTPCRQFAIERALPRGILATDEKFAGASREAVADPALQRRIIVGQRALGKVERVAVRDAVAHINFAVTGRQGDAKQEAGKTHTAAYEIVNEPALNRFSFLTFFTVINDPHTV